MLNQLRYLLRFHQRPRFVERNDVPIDPIHFGAPPENSFTTRGVEPLMLSQQNSSSSNTNEHTIDISDHTTSSISHSRLGGLNRHQIVRLSIRPDRQSASEHFSNATPNDIFLYIFSFLNQSQLAQCASVCRSWLYLVFDASLWTEFHLCSIYDKVDDQLINHLLNAHNFDRLQKLCLDNCRAITVKSLHIIITRLNSLESLSLIHCDRLRSLPARTYIELLNALPKLKSLELYGACTEYSEVMERVFSLNRKVKIDMGLFEMMYYAERGIIYQSPILLNQNMIEDEPSLTRNDNSPTTNNHMNAANDANINRAVNGAPPSINAATTIASLNSRRQFQPAQCRHARVSGCMGNVRGKIIYGMMKHNAGNYPIDIVYSCDVHNELDFSDPQFERCRICERLLRPTSMYSSLICCVCFDFENIFDRRSWIELSDSSIDRFGLNEILEKTIRIADRKNLPRSLRVHGIITSLRFDYTIDRRDERLAGTERAGHVSRRGSRIIEWVPPDQNERNRNQSISDQDDEKQSNQEISQYNNNQDERHVAFADRDDIIRDVEPLLPDSHNSLTIPLLTTRRTINLSAVPMSIFLDKNSARLEHTIDQCKTVLSEARKAGCNRALLVLTSDEDIAIYADSRVISDGYEGESYLNMMNAAWSASQRFILPIIGLMLINVHFAAGAREIFFTTPTVTTTDYKQFIGSLSTDQNASTIDPVTLIILIGVFIILVAAGAFVYWRFRRLVERMFRRFLVLNMACILAAASSLVLYVIFRQINAYFDWISFSFIIVQFVLLCIYSLFENIPVGLHQMSVIALNCSISLFLTSILGIWFSVGCLSLVTLCDIISEFRPATRLLSPILQPDSFLIPTTPRVLYTVAGIHIRPLELFFYGLLSIMTEMTLISIVIVCGLLSILVFVCPYVTGYRKWLVTRPIPTQFAFAFLILWIEDPIISAFQFAQNFVRLKDAAVEL